LTEQPNAGHNEQAPQKLPYDFYVAVLAIASACLVYFLSMWAFGDLFQGSAATVLGSLFTLIGTVAGAYFGIKVSSDTYERSQGAIERAQGRTEEAHRGTEDAHNMAQQALAELSPDVARRIAQGGSRDASR
jgi:Kef-type K+ transport system membrane component KefB